MDAIEYPYRPGGWDKMIYPMPAFPTLAASDVARSSAWYQEVLGFADVFTLRGHDGSPMLAHLRWCVYADVLLVPARGRIDGAGVSLNFATVDIDESASRIRARGAEIHEGPVVRPWNARDLVMLDPDGYRLTFTAPLPGEGERFDEVMAKARNGVRDDV